MKTHPLLKTWNNYITAGQFCRAQHSNLPLTKMTFTLLEFFNKSDLQETHGFQEMLWLLSSMPFENSIQLLCGRWLNDFVLFQNIFRSFFQFLPEGHFFKCNKIIRCGSRVQDWGYHVNPSRQHTRLESSVQQEPLLSSTWPTHRLEYILLQHLYNLWAASPNGKLNYCMTLTCAKTPPFL